LAKDHFVAQTYLKHFGDPKIKGMLHAYRKPDGATFQCWPKDVCHEWDGDLNPEILNRPELLGDYRKIFEPQWDPALAKMLSHDLSAGDKFVIAAYMANLMVCTPAWRRVGQEMYGQNIVSTLSAKNEVKQQSGQPDETLAEGLAMIKAGTLRVEVDANHIKAKSTRQLLVYACLAYNLDWLVKVNETDQPYLTSDNPVAMRFSGRHLDPLTRLFPVSPKVSLEMTYDPRKLPRIKMEDVTAIMRSPPRGEVRRSRAKPGYVRMVNRTVVQCAESLVFSNRPDIGAGKLVSKYAKYRVEPEAAELPSDEPNSRILGTIIRVRASTAT
jgi:hypothetical protein